MHATGELESLPDGMYLDADEELVERIEASTDYVRLPNQYDIHEYRIMEQFAETVSDKQKQAELFRALRGKRPFRRFKDELNYFRLTSAYYDFRFLAFTQSQRLGGSCSNFPSSLHTRTISASGSSMGRHSIRPPTNCCIASSVLSIVTILAYSVGSNARTRIFSSFISTPQ